MPEKVKNKVFEFVATENLCFDNALTALVGNWTYPLLPGRSPVLRSSWGPYIFPDVSPNVITGSSVGLTIPTSDVARFEEVLKEFTAFQDEEDVVSSAAADGYDIASNLAAYIPEKFIYRESPGVLVSQGMTDAKIKLRSLLGADAASTSDSATVPVDPHVCKQVPIDSQVRLLAKGIRESTTKAVIVSAIVVDQVDKATVKLSKVLAPQVKKVVSQGRTKEFEDLAVIAAQGLKGSLLVYTELLTASSLLAKGLAQETVKTVHDRYGSDAGELTENVLASVGNMVGVWHYTNVLAAKHVALRVAEEVCDEVSQKNSSVTGGQELSSIEDTLRKDRTIGGKDLTEKKSKQSTKKKSTCCCSIC
ncbi:hypothetical protein LSAT2_005153 [Lamellibrachia satsuma]|nr:hypothetical protein LSAT2_005153 [Lamellibrachia satsuma]